MDYENHTYDKASWHYEADDFPDGLPEEHGYTHTGFFMTWLAERGLLSENEMVDLKFFHSQGRKLSPIYLYENVGGCLFSNMLLKQANDFAIHYFDFGKGDYLNDYEKLLGESYDNLYQIEPSWENYDRVKLMLNERYEGWLNPKPKRFWQFWK